MKKNIIISGASGFIGRALVKYLNNLEYSVICLVHKKENLISLNNVSSKLFSLDDVSSLLTEIPHQKDAIFLHLAWCGSIGKERGDPFLQLKNVNQSLQLLKIAKEIGCQRFIFVSSIAENESYRITTENCGEIDSHFFYGAAKLSTRMFLEIYAKELNIEFINAKLCNVYGIGDYSHRMLNSTLIKCINRETLCFTSGVQNYDFVYIDDVVKALKLIIEKGKASSKYTIGSGRPRKLKDFLTELNINLFPGIKFTYGNVPFKGVNLDLTNFSIEELSRDTGYSPAINFIEGCKKTSDWIKTWTK